jgi:DNA-binding MarR family transcriptional regulator
LYLDSGTLTPLLKKLEEKGLINRRRSAMDERNLIVTLTPAGEAMKDAALNIHDDMAKLVNLSSEEAVTLYRLLYKLLEVADNVE